MLPNDSVLKISIDIVKYILCISSLENMYNIKQYTAGSLPYCCCHAGIEGQTVEIVRGTPRIGEALEELQIRRHQWNLLYSC